MLYRLQNVSNKKTQRKNTHLESKQRVWTRFRPSLSQREYNLYINYKTLISVKKKQKVKKKHTHLQMTPDTLFGPVFTVAALPVACFVGLNLHVL